MPMEEINNIEEIDDDIEEEEENEILRPPSYWIDVSQKNIDEGKIKNSAACPNADGVKDTLPWARRVEVDMTTIRFTDPEKGVRYYYHTPRKAQEMIINFDQGNTEKCVPFRFKLKGADGQVRKSGNTSEKVKEMKRAYNRKRKELVFNDNEFHSTSSPTIVGGDAPPVGRTKRTFGMRNWSE